MRNILDFFENVMSLMTPTAPPTEGIKYAGSKLKLLPHILQLAQKVNPQTIFDGFSGTTRVSQAFAQSGYRVIANDVAAWSKVFGDCYLLNPFPREHYEELIDHLNALPGRTWMVHRALCRRCERPKRLKETVATTQHSQARRDSRRDRTLSFKRA